VGPDTSTLHAVTVVASITGPAVLSFEQRSTCRRTPGQAGWAAIDSVSLKDNAGFGTERITNGTFETGDLTGWSTNIPRETQNMTSGSRDMGGNVRVTRSFYTQPSSLWGRFTD